MFLSLNEKTGIKMFADVFTKQRKHLKYSVIGYKDEATKMFKAKL